MLGSTFAEKMSLRGSSRVPPISRSESISVTELACLLASGALAAAAVGLLHLSLRLPGHAILRGTLPMAMGLALVPRRWAGVVMSVGAAMTSVVMTTGGIGGFPATSMLSVLALGPILDIALLGRSKGCRLYLR